MQQNGCKVLRLQFSISLYSKLYFPETRIKANLVLLKKRNLILMLEIEQKSYLNFSSVCQGLSPLKYLQYLKIKFK